MTVEVGLQVGIALGGLTALLLVSLDRPAGYLVGLLTQPLWVVAAWRLRAWGILALSLAYGVVWAVGCCRHYGSPGLRVK